MRTRTMADVKKINKNNGNCFFSPRTVKFWNSKVETRLIGEKYFVTSEDNFDRTAPEYTIRMIDWQTGSIETIGNFQSFKTLNAALERLKELLKEQSNGH